MSAVPSKTINSSDLCASIFHRISELENEVRSVDDLLTAVSLIAEKIPGEAAGPIIHLCNLARHDQAVVARIREDIFHETHCFAYPGTAIGQDREPSQDVGAICTMYKEWQASRQNCTTDKPDAEVDALYAQYVDLQGRITATTPLSVSDLAMQIVVETDAGESVWRDDFYDRVAKIADQAVA